MPLFKTTLQTTSGFFRYHSNNFVIIVHTGLNLLTNWLLYNIVFLFQLKAYTQHIFNNLTLITHLIIELLVLANFAAAQAIYLLVGSNTLDKGEDPRDGDDNRKPLQLLHEGFWKGEKINHAQLGRPGLLFLGLKPIYTFGQKKKQLAPSSSVVETFDDVEERLFSAENSTLLEQPQSTVEQTSRNPSRESSGVQDGQDVSSELKSFTEDVNSRISAFHQKWRKGVDYYIHGDLNDNESTDLSFKRKPKFSWKQP